MAALPDLGKLFGKGSVAEQLVVYNVLGQVISAILAPELQLLQNTVQSITQEVPLAPAAAADMVVRNILTEAEGAAEARKSGVSPDDFHRLVLDTGDAPGPMQLLEAVRRGILSWDAPKGDLPSALQGLRQGRLRDEWAPLIHALAFTPIPTGDAVDAVVESQIDYSAGEAIAFQNGIMADDFRILFNTRGNPPSPTELMELVRRGIIPMGGLGPDATSLDQGIAEGATKNKWTFAYEALTEAIPPPRTVTALLRNGSIDDATATALFKKAGLSQAMAEAYTHDAHHQKLQATKDLAKADILQLYYDRIVSHDDAVAMLVALRYTPEEAAFELAIVDFRRELAALNQAIGRVHNLYVAHKLDKPAAVSTLDALHVPAAQRDQLLGVWDVERGANVKVLSAAEIASAFFYKVIAQAEAQAELEAQGWTPRDAWILLSVRMHAPLPNPPAPGPGA